MKHEFICQTLSELPEIAPKIIQAYPNHRLFAFYGAMGSGKTTLIKQLCQYLQVVDFTSSPTFALVNEYRTFFGDPVYHFDFYRIKNPVEILDIGFEDYLHSNAYCFMEWAEKAEQLLPEEIVRVYIKVEPESQIRKFITQTFSS